MVVKQWLVSLLFVCLAVGGCTQNEPVALTGNELNLFRTAPAQNLTGFDAFLDFAAAESTNESLSGTIARYRAGKSLGPIERENIARLLGLYTALAHEQDMIDQLARLVAIPTAARPGIPQHENPAIVAIGEELAAMAAAFGLEFRNVDNRVFEISLPGETDEWLGLFTHADVVPADADKWVLEDGTRLDPFTLTRIDGRLYGRGSEDDKSPIVTALFAMKALKDSGLPRKRGIRLVVETTEETTQQGVEYYKDRNDLPAYNLVLDGSYPIGVAEKGYGEVWAHFAARPADFDTAVLSVEGALAPNQIPASASAHICCIDQAVAVSRLNAIAEEIVGEHGGGVRAEAEPGSVALTIQGESAHSSEPASGLNPVPRLFLILHAARREGIVGDNHITDAARYVVENWGIDYYGEKLGIAYADEFMGPLTAAVTYARESEGVLSVAVNLRAPRGREPEALVAEINEKLSDWAQRTGTEVTFEAELEHYMVRDPSGRWIETITDTFTTITGLEGTPRSDAGSTTAKQLPMGVSFGPSWPGEKYTGHNANEFKRIDRFMTDTQIYTEMAVRLTGLESME